MLAEGGGVVDLKEEGKEGEKWGCDERKMRGA